MRIRLIVFITGYFFASLLQAGNSTSGFEFLRTEFSPRAASMGRAFVAMRGDLNGLYHNPAGMSFSNQNQFSVNYTDYLLDFGGGFAAYSHRLSGLGQLSGSIIWLNYGNFEETDEFALKTGRIYSAYDLAFAVSYADVLEDYFSYGVTVKYIHSKIDLFSADALAFDFGLLYAAPFEDNLFFGLSLLNVGKPLNAFVETKESLPLSVRLGVAKKLEHLPLELNVTLNDINVNEPSFWDRLAKFSIGGEFTLSEVVRLRLGYENEIHHDLIDTGTGSRFSGVSIGFGLFWNIYRFDYGYSDYGDLGGTHRLGIYGAF